MNTAFVIMAKPPEFGKVKTRLAKNIGQRKTLTLYQACLADVCGAAVQTSAAKFIFWSGDAYLRGCSKLLSQPLRSQFSHRTQVPGDLGQKIAGVFQTVFAEGFTRVIVVGSDFPGLDVLHWQAAEAALQTHDVVLGPTQDGGYYLIGLTKFHPTLFAAMPWSQATLFQATLACCKKHTLSVATLAKGRDIDQIQDIMALATERLLSDQVRRVLKQFAYI